MANHDPYYDRGEVSNSDLTWLKKYWQPGIMIDLEKVYRFGTLVDCLITEPAKVNIFNRTCAQYTYSADEMKMAEEMYKAFMRDEFCSKLLSIADKQKVSVNPKFKITIDNFSFTVPFRGKWDLFVKAFDQSGEIKTTACETQKQFEESIFYFEYDRQGSVYIDLENRNNHMIIGISKKNFRIFKVPFVRNGHLYKRGKQLYESLAFDWWSYFAHLPNLVN